MILNRESFKEKMAAFLKIKATKLTDEAVLTDLVTESFILVEMVIELQEEFSVRLVQEDLKHVKTFGDLIRVFESHAK